MLRNSFDANHGDGGDHAAILANMQRKVLDGRAEMSVEDLRKVFDPSYPEVNLSGRLV